MTINKHVNKKVFETSDLALSTTISIWFPLQSVDKSEPRRVVFIFERTKDLDELVDKYWRKELLVEPRLYFDQLKSLKARLYSNE